MKQVCVSIALLLFSVISVAQTQGEIIDRIIGVIGDEIILQSELENDLIQMKMNGQDPDGLSKCSSFEQLLFQNLLLNQARIDSLVVSESQIQGTIGSSVLTISLAFLVPLRLLKQNTENQSHNGDLISMIQLKSNCLLSK